MAFNEGRTDLFLTLYDGEVREAQGDREGGFQHVYFQKQIVPLRGVGDELDRRMGGADRGDREMDFATLRAEAEDRDVQQAEVMQRGRERSLEAVRIALGRAASADSSLVGTFRLAQRANVSSGPENACLLYTSPSPRD